MHVAKAPISLDLSRVAALREALDGDWAWLDSAIGDADRGKRSLVALELEPVVELWPQHGVVYGRGGSPAIVSAAELLRAADRAFALDGRRCGGEAPGWVGYIAWEAAFAADVAFARPDEGVPYPLLRFDRIVAAVVADGGGPRLVAVGSTEGAAVERLTRWQGLLDGQPNDDRTESEVLHVDAIDSDIHKNAVRTIVAEIYSGRVFQACYTFPIFGQQPQSFLHVYERLKSLSPGDYGALLRLGDLRAACVSPERFVQVDGRQVLARPMKGTRLRRDSEPGGAAILAASEKDRAENVMIVDLMRNDLGRVCEVGSVDVPALFEVETYETVHQMTSTVRGQLRSDVGPFALLAAIFPPGSMSGAPKVEACRLLSELETEQRGIYGGTIGWLGFDGRWTFSVVIRALQAWLGRARWDVGGGITALSDADAEFDEAMAKARPLAALTEPAGYIRRERP